MINWAKWYRRLSRFNTIAFTIVLLLVGTSISSALYREFFPEEYSGAADSLGRASVGKLPLSGEEIRVKGARFVRYYVTEEAGSFDWKPGTNITFVDTQNGRSHKILADGDPRKLIAWELIYSDDKEREGHAYLAWAATRTMEAEGRADLLIAGLPELKQHVLAKNARFADAPQVHGDDRIAVIVWQDEDRADFVVFDLAKREVVQKNSVDVPAIPENTLSSKANALGKRLRNEEGGAASPAAKYF